MIHRQNEHHNTHTMLFVLNVSADDDGVKTFERIDTARFYNGALCTFCSFPHSRTSLWRKVLVAHYLRTQGCYFSMILFVFLAHLCLYVFIKMSLGIRQRLYAEVAVGQKKRNANGNNPS